MKNYYEILNTCQGVSRNELEKAYQLALLKSRDYSAELYLQIKQAYEILNNPSLRQIYDLSLRSNIYDWNAMPEMYTADVRDTETDMVFAF